MSGVSILCCERKYMAWRIRCFWLAVTAGETYMLIGSSHVLGKRLLLPSQKDFSHIEIESLGRVMIGG